MKIRSGNKLKVRQKLTWQRVILVTSVAFTVAGLAIIAFQLKHPQKAMAATCDSSYTLNWSDPSTYTVSCGSVNASNWSVKGFTCFYYSPVFNVGGNVGDPDKEADIAVRINQSGNLDGNDTAWVYMYSNDSIVNTFRCMGDSIAAVFSTYQTFMVPAGGTYKIVVKLKNDKTNETWQIKNGDVTSCLRTLNPLPISLAGFTAKINPSNKTDLNWTTYTEVNNDFFTIERSATGQSFEPIININGAGNSSSVKKYSCTDEHPLQGINYYRLKQTDYDGTATYSAVKKVSLSKTSPGVNDILVFPNPFKSDFSVKFNSETEQDLIVRLITMDGRVLFSEQYHTIQGSNSVSCYPSARVISGNYLIQLVSNEKVIGSVKAICR